MIEMTLTSHDTPFIQYLPGICEVPAEMPNEWEPLLIIKPISDT